MRHTPLLIGLTLCLFLAGCIARSDVGPAGSAVTRTSAAAALDTYAEKNVPLRRPVVVLSGYHTLPIHAAPLASDIARSTSGRREDVLVVSYPLAMSIDDAVDSVIEEVEERWPSPDPAATVEVDVVGISMGGIVARWAALPPARRLRGDQPAAAAASKRLRVARLFTFASPHRGARLAQSLAIDDAAVDLKPGSALLRTLDQADRPYELVCYAHTGDLIVGATRTAPPGMHPIWTEGTLLFSHFSVVTNPVFVQDTVRRLRDEPPLIAPRDPPPRD
jgi:hypothetical protein